MHSGAALIDPKDIFTKISLGQGMRIADLGCGRTGHLVFPSAKIVGEKGIVYAVEIMKDILEGIKKQASFENFHNVQTIWADIEKYGFIPIPHDSLDACFMVNVLFLLDNKKEAMREAQRLLKSGGYLVVADWEKKIGPLGPEKEKMISAEEVKKIAISLGFKVIDKISPSDYHYAVILKKE